MSDKIAELNKQCNEGLISEIFLYEELGLMCKKCNCVYVGNHETKEECDLARVEMIMTD